MFTLRAQIEGADHTVYIQCIERIDAVGNFFTWYFGMVLINPLAEGLPIAASKVNDLINGDLKLQKMDVPAEGLSLWFHDNKKVKVSWLKK